MTKTYRTARCEYGYVRSPKEIAGRMEPFRPHWWAQYLGNGDWTTFATKKECLAWCLEWNDPDIRDE